MYLTFQERPSQPLSVIAEVQGLLNNIRPHITNNSHYRWEYLAVDGLFGPNTRDAIAAFQVVKQLRPPVYGVLGDTTYNSIKFWDSEFKSRLNRVTYISAGSARPINEKRLPTGRDIAEGIGMTADWASLFAEENPFVRKFIESLPKVWQKMCGYNEKPAFIFRNPHGVDGDIYKRINWNSTLVNHLAVIGFATQVFTIGPQVRDFRNSWASGDYGERTRTSVKTGSSIMQLILGAPQAWVSARTVFNSKNLLVTGAGGVQTGVIAGMARFCNYIGAFMIGWMIGEFIGGIKLPNGHTVQYYIDRVIDEVWDHPYQTVGKLGPTGLSIATSIAAWKKCIELWVNRVKVLKPLSPEEKVKLEKYIKEHPDFVYNRQ